jgi:hypothetical protein
MKDSIWNHNKSKLNWGYIDTVGATVTEELQTAINRYPEFNSAHEGLAIIMEEFDELKDEVYVKQSKRDWGAMFIEATQLITMTLRLCHDIILPQLDGKETGND